MNEYLIDMEIRLSIDHSEVVMADTEDEAWDMVVDMIKKDEIDPMFDRHSINEMEIDNYEICSIKKL